MCSKRQQELYTEFEPDANEILFGRRTAPDRPLTDKEVSQRKRIILKLVDQKLKIELIEMMNRHQEETGALNAHSSSTSPIASSHTYTWTMPYNNCGYQNFDQLPQFGNTWQPPNYPQEWENFQQYDYRESLQCIQHYDEFRTPLFHTDHPNPNLIHLLNEPLKANETECTSRPTTSKGISIPSEKTLQNVSPTSKTKPLHSIDPLKCSPMSHETSSIEGKSSTFSIEATKKETRKRKPECFNEDVPKNLFLVNDNTANRTVIKKSASYSHARNMVVAGTTLIKTESVIDPIIDLTIDNTTDEIDKVNSDRNESAEWCALNELVTNLFRSISKNLEPLTPIENQLKNEILIQMSINPNGIHSNSDAQQIREKVGEKKFDEFINECRIILNNLRRAGAAHQAYFSESQNKLFEELKELNCRRETLTKIAKFHSANLKIGNIMFPFLCRGKDHQDLILELIKDPQALQSNEIIKNEIAAKGQSVNDVMKSIRDALDEFIPVRSPKKFYLPVDKFVDVPFVVNLYDRTVNMTEEYSTQVAKVLFDTSTFSKIETKLSFRDIKFKDGSLEILCLNSASFDWLKNTIPKHLGVKIRPVKNVITKNQLKTICLKFNSPQYLHFNYLMEQLKVDNPRLLTRRWESRSSQREHLVDSTKCEYLGVDVESLIILEEMNRVGFLRNSTVSFEIDYNENEENFEKMTFVKKKN